MLFQKYCRRPETFPVINPGSFEVKHIYDLPEPQAKLLLATVCLENALNITVSNSHKISFCSQNEQFLGNIAIICFQVTC